MISSSRPTISSIFFSMVSKVLGRERLLAMEVIIKPILGRRTKGDLGAREKFLHRLGQNMGRVMANQFQRVIILDRDDRERGIRVDGRARSRISPSTLTAKRGLGQAGPISAANFRAGHAARMGARAAIGQRDRDLVGRFSFGHIVPILEGKT